MCKLFIQIYFNQEHQYIDILWFHTWVKGGIIHIFFLTKILLFLVNFLRLNGLWNLYAHLARYMDCPMLSNINVYNLDWGQMAALSLEHIFNFTEQKSNHGKQYLVRCFYHRLVIRGKLDQIILRPLRDCPPSI